MIIHRRIELAKLMSRSDLTDIVTAFAEALNLSGGIVRMPKHQESIPTQPKHFAKWRLTDVTCGSSFCRIVRKCKRGDVKCMWSDLEYAAEAARTGSAEVYRCHMRLIDVVAAVKIAGHHVANVYLGQGRPPDLDFETVWKNYCTIFEESTSSRSRPVSCVELKKAFDCLPVRDDSSMQKIGLVVQSMADLISQRCTKQLALKCLSDIGEAPGARWSIHAGMTAFLRCAEAVLDCDTASIFLLDEDGSHLRSEVLDWDQVPEGMQISFAPSDRGLIPTVFRKNRSILRSSAAAIAKTKPRDPAYRKLRRLRSFVGCPIRYQSKVMGVIEVGSSKEHAFITDDDFLLKTIANQAGVFLGGLRDRAQLLRIFAHGNAMGISQALVERVAPVVDGAGCSLFMRTGTNPEAVLLASDEFPVAYRGSIGYPPGRGLTGWVLEHGIAMRLNGGRGCRTDRFPRDRYPGAIWEGAHKAADLHWRKDFSCRPFIAVPVFDRMRHIVGVLRVSDRGTGDFTEQDQVFLQECADYIGFAHQWTEKSEREYLESARRVFISHGHNWQVVDAVQDFLRDRLGLTPVVLEKQAPGGKTIIEQLEFFSRSCCFAIIICTGDDIMKGGKRRPRQNVVHELGFLHSLHGRGRIVVLSQRKVELFSNIDGLIRIQFSGNDVASAFEPLRKALEAAHIIGAEGR